MRRGYSTTNDENSAHLRATFGCTSALICVLFSGQPYNKDTILEYLAFCQQEVAERVPRLKLAEPEGHGDRSLITLELQIYSIRHLMQHTGELMERLGSLTGAEIDWVGSMRG